MVSGGLCNLDRFSNGEQAKAACRKCALNRRHSSGNEFLSRILN